MLLIDAGNTRIKLDWLDAGDAWRASSGYAFTLTERAQMRQWLARLPARPVGVLGVNVAGGAAASVLESLFDCPVQWIQPQPSALGVRNGYDEPGRLGADRWAAMLGLAWHQRRRPAHARPASAVLAMFGTATTVDTLGAVPGALRGGGEACEDNEFDFRGGLILPGPAMMLASLSTGTANLPQAEGDVALYPTHTHQAIASGVAAAQAGAVLRQWLAGLRVDGRPPEVYAAGGGWPLVSDEIQRLLDEACNGLGLPMQPIHRLEAPVLDGLACLARQAGSSIGLQKG